MVDARFWFFIGAKIHIIFSFPNILALIFVNAHNVNVYVHNANVYVFIFKVFRISKIF